LDKGKNDKNVHFVGIRSTFEFAYPTEYILSRVSEQCEIELKHA